MSSIIYNEGRVVGFSAYEIYIRHLLSQDPDAVVPTEKQWLSATIGRGSSMLLKIPSGTQGIYEVELPKGSKLCASGVITASVFNGDAEFDESGWATRVTSYGSLISNTDKLNPPISTGVPVGEFDWEATLDIMKAYLNITDGIFIQPGTWAPKEGYNPPAKDFIPNPKGLGYVRLKVAKKTTSTTYILLTGFMNRTILTSLITEKRGCLNTPFPQDGDFLGPQEFPWASKIIFTVPNEARQLLEDYGYIRQFTIDDSYKVITNKSVVDFETADPKTYYTQSYSDSDPRKNHVDSAVKFEATEMNVTGSGVSALTLYQNLNSKVSSDIHGGAYPPILYGAKHTDDSMSSQMFPIDIAAPGTVKLFTNVSNDDNITKHLALNYPKVVPNVYAIYREVEYDTSGRPINEQIYYIDKNTTVDTMIPFTSNIETVLNSNDVYESSVSSKGKSIKALSLVDTSGDYLSTSGSSGSIDLTDTDKLSWDNLLEALKDNKTIDILGKVLEYLRQTSVLEMKDDKKTPDRLHLKDGLEVDGQSTFNDNVSVTKSLKLNTEFGYNSIEFNNRDGLNDVKLYVSGDDPSSDSTEVIPEGSIWIKTSI